MSYRVAICGIDGSGKSSLVQKLFAHYNQQMTTQIAKVNFHCKKQCARAFSTKFSVFPGSVERAIVQRIGMAFEFLDYYEKLDVFNGLLLCDRYDVCFQVLNRVDRLPTAFINLLDLLFYNVQSANAYIYLDIPTQIASQRLTERGDREEDECDMILKSMKKEYHKLLHEKDNVFTVRASNSKEEVFNESVRIIDGLMARRDADYD